MKLRNFIIVLFALLMVFAFASCKNEPEVPQPKPDDPTGKIEHPIYQIVVDEGVEVDYYNRDKIKLRWTDVEVNSGSVISLKYRSEREIYQWDIRDEGAGIKWVYETKKNGFVDPVKGEDGWYTLTYTITDTVVEGEADYPNDAIAVYFRGRFAQGDVFEIKDVTLDGKPLAITSNTIISKAHLEGDGAIEEHEWTIAENYVYLLAMGELGSVDKNPIIAKVAPNAAVDLSKIPTKENYKIHIYSDSAFANELADTAPVTKDATIIYYKYVGDPRVVTIDLNGGTAESAIESITAEYGSPISAPTMIPTVTDGKLFAGWYKNLTDEAPYDFSTAVMDNFTLYAKYTDPVTVHFNTGDGNAVADAIIASGTSVDEPEEDPTYPANLFMFAGWFADPECTIDYDWSTIITAETTIYAKWVDAKRVTFNLNYEGAPEATVIGVDTGSKATKPEKIPMRSGWVFDGWYTEAECTNEYNFDTAVTADTPLFAKWSDGNIYKTIATNGDGGTTYDKFILDWQDGTVKVNKDDVLAFAYRTTVEFQLFNIRDNETDIDTQKDKWVYESGPSSLTSHVEGADGWIYVTYKFGEKFAGGGTVTYPGVFRFDFISKNIRPGDILEVKAITLNGEEIALTKVDACSTTFTTLEAMDDWTATHTVTFVYDDGDGDTRGYTTDALAFFTPAPLPEDVEKEDKTFVGWYTDNEFKNKFDPSTKLTENLTLYGYWVSPVTVTFHDGETTKTLDVPYGSTITENDIKGLGFSSVGFFAQLCSDSDKTIQFDLSTEITAEKDLYLKWVAPTKSYKYTVTDLGGDPDDRIQFRFKSGSDYAPILTDLKTGDTITFMVKTTAALAKIRVRTVSGSKDVFKYYTIPDAASNVWMPVTLEITTDYLNCGGITMALYNAATEEGALVAGDTVEIKALAINGVEIPISTTSTSCGLYPSHSDTDKFWYGVPADVEVINL